MLKAYHSAEVQFDIIKEIGQAGKNSNTFVVHDHQLNAEIVSKRIEKSRLNSPAEFFEESRSLYASAHPNVVQIHYACFDNDHVYVAMPYYRNGSVKDVIDSRFLTVREIITLGAQTLAGLHNIHSKGLMHFDIKPDNVLLSPRGEALLSDFGLAKQMNYRGIAAQDRHYGPAMPPEAFGKDQFDRTFDIYQFGLMLYRMCNGNDHWNAQFAKYLDASGQVIRADFKFDVENGRFPDRKDFLPHVPSTLRNVIRKCLDKIPADRYQSALEVANAMAGIDGECLDWQYNPSPATKTWEKHANATVYQFTIKADGSTEGKKSVNGGNYRRIGDLTKNSMSDADIKKVFRSY